MGRTACTEPQCLYKGDLYLHLYINDLMNRKNITQHTIIRHCLQENHVPLMCYWQHSVRPSLQDDPYFTIRLFPWGGVGNPLIVGLIRHFVLNIQSVILPFSLKLEAVDNLRLLLTEVPQMQAIIRRGGDQRALV